MTFKGDKSRAEALRASPAKTYETKASQGYRWIEKDPIIDVMMALCKDDGRSLTAIANAAWLSPTTLHNWDQGNTRKPNHISVVFVLRALGYEQKLHKLSKEERLKAAPRWRVKQ